MKKKIGLVLGGGGAKGAYQIGVLKAMDEYKLLKHIHCISATSIGALNAMKILDKDLKGAIEIWKNVSKEIALTKTSVFNIFKTKSIFSREGFIKLANEKIDFEKVSKSKIICFVIATPLSKKMSNAPSEFMVNGKDKDTIMSYLLASSAIPIVFEPVVIDGVKYMDGFKVSNTPVETLKNKGCDLIFAIPLKETSDAYIYADDKTTIIDFVSTTNNQGIKEGTLDFVSSRCIERMNQGYIVGKALIAKLIKERVIGVKWYQKLIVKWKSRFSKKERSNYYYLSESEIEKLKFDN